MRLLVLDADSSTITHSRTEKFPRFLREGDLLVVNDAATLPASLWATTTEGHPIETRLISAGEDGSYDAVLFGGGSWRDPTENRALPVLVSEGEELVFSSALRAQVESHPETSRRWVRLRFNLNGARLLAEIYRTGKLIQYSYAPKELALWSAQNVYAGRPWAMEMPSAGRPLQWGMLLELKRSGVGLARLTHGAGISSTGDRDLDRSFPIRERYEIPSETMDAVARTRQRGGRVIAVGTSVVRALESAASGSSIRGWTNLRITPEFQLRIVDGLLSGIHDPSESHYDLLGAFASRQQLEQVTREADALGYQHHEFGDSFLVLRRNLPNRQSVVKQLG